MDIPHAEDFAAAFLLLACTLASAQTPVPAEHNGKVGVR